MKRVAPTLPHTHRLNRSGRAALSVFVAPLLLLPGFQATNVLADDTAALREKVATLEKRLAEVEQEQGKERNNERLREVAKQKARDRAREDQRTYKPEELREIETLYQVANQKGKRSEEAKQSLKQLLEKYDKANRTGCALLYLGQASEGNERIEYLTRAVEKFSDCYYFNGCQVGGYGRYVLALTHSALGEKDKATARLRETRASYSDSIAHDGRPMVELVEAAEKELGIAAK